MTRQNIPVNSSKILIAKTLIGKITDYPKSTFDQFVDHKY